MLLRIIEIVCPLFAIITIGAVYARLFRPSLEDANRLNMDVFIPALVFSALSDKAIDVGAYSGLALGACIVILGAGLMMWLLIRPTGIQAKTLLPPVMFHNAGNMGLPLLLFAFGSDALPSALLLFLIGNFAHFGLGTYLLDSSAGVRGLLKQPVLLSAALALAVSFSGLTVPAALARPIDLLGQIAIPLMLFSLGVRLAHADLGEWRIGLLGAAVTPMAGFFIAWLVLWFLPLPDIQAGCLLLFGALPPAVLNFLFAERYDQEPAKVASIVMLGNLVAALALPCALAYTLPRYG